VKSQVLDLLSASFENQEPYRDLAPVALRSKRERPFAI